MHIKTLTLERRQRQEGGLAWDANNRHIGARRHGRGGRMVLEQSLGEKGRWGEAGRGAPGRMQANPQSQYNTQITCMNIIRACLG